MYNQSNQFKLVIGIPRNGNGREAELQREGKPRYHMSSYDIDEKFISLLQALSRRGKSLWNSYNKTA